MPRSSRNLTFPAVIVLLAAASLSASAAVVRVPAEGVPTVRNLGVSPRIDLDYGAFRWLELDDAGLARLDAAGVPYELVPNAGQVKVNGFVFDPLGWSWRISDRDLSVNYVTASLKPA